MSSLTQTTPNRTAMLAANNQYAAQRPAATAQLGRHPTKKYLIITCMDARIDPAAAFGIQPGDAHVIRNAGGSAKAALRDIVVSTHFYGVDEVFIIKPRDSVLSGQLHDAIGTPILQQIYPRSIACPGASSIVDLPFHEYECPYAAVRADWWYVQNHPAIRASDPPNRIKIHGFVYDPATGRLDNVPPRVPPAQRPIAGSQPNGADDEEEQAAGGACGKSQSCPADEATLPPARLLSTPTAPTTNERKANESTRQPAAPEDTTNNATTVTSDASTQQPATPEQQTSNAPTSDNGASQTPAPRTAAGNRRTSTPRSGGGTRSSKKAAAVAKAMATANQAALASERLRNFTFNQLVGLQ